MHKSVLTIGLLLLLAGFYIADQGSQVLNPLAQTIGLVSHVQTESTIITPTLVTVPASNYSFLTAELTNNVQMKGSLEVSERREISFYVIDEGNFSAWRSAAPSEVVLAKPTAISYNFTFTPRVSGTYYFVFDNQDNDRRVVVFSLYAVRNVAIVNRVLGYFGYGMLTIGIILSVLGVKIGRSKPQSEGIAFTGWQCKFCEAENTSKEMFCDKCGRSQR